MIKGFKSGTGGAIFSGNCFSRVLTVEPSGDVYPCPSTVTDPDYFFGNLTESPLTEILSSEKRLSLILKQKQFFCDCEFFHLCHGGCPLFFNEEKDTDSCKTFFSRFVCYAEELSRYF